MSTPPEQGGSGQATVRWRLRVAYDGSGFHGFAAQEGLPTVAGTLAEALSRVTRTPVTLTCAGRTDAGVHALDQMVHFDVPVERSSALEPAALIKSCNSQIGPAIVVRTAEIAPDGFDARHSATSRRYRYLVVNAPVPDPLLAGLTWHVPDPLDLRAMVSAADALLGEHDFRAFCRRVPGTTADDPIPRRVVDARWTKLDGRPSGARTAGTSDLDAERNAATGPSLAPVVGDLLAFEIEANAFCHQMVRSLVGTLVEVGRGRKRASDMLPILRSADRSQAGQPAPPHGLTLMVVRY
ncbi:MAG: tRNA pseudouridine synthase A [Acidimicrobiales bacterium]